jgi:exonuclease III
VSISVSNCAILIQGTQTENLGRANGQFLILKVGCFGVLGVGEIRWNGCGRTETTNGKVFVYSGMPIANDDHIRGLEILINTNMRGALLEWNPVSERIIIARIRTKLRKITIVQCYATTESAELVEKEAFYNFLDKTLLSIKRRDMIVMMGDFNAKVGKNNQDIEHIICRHGLPCENENENGHLLIELCGKNGLLIGGMIFPHRDCHKVTWASPSKDKQVENQIDHICIGRNWSKSLLAVRNKRGADIGSDHHMIMGILRIKIQKFKRKNIN